MQILLYSVLLLLVTILPYLAGMSGVIYLASAVILGVIFLVYAIKIYRRPDDPKVAWDTFMYSVKYLMLIFIALLIDHYWLIRVSI
jgi:protoheme IX farnesyltransferase